MSKNDGPADTRIMDIVHSALKRDLRRARAVLGTAPPQGRQRQALGRHVTWMMDFLHAHHSGEDAGLWPLVRERSPSATALWDSLEADHARIAPAAEAVQAAADSYTTGTTDRERAVLVQALDDLIEVLVPHLDREVAEGMPLVAACLSAREWDAIEQEHNIKPKSMSQLAMEGHWLIEGADPQTYDVVVHKVPALVRPILIHGFARRYRREAAARWTADASTAAA